MGARLERFGRGRLGGGQALGGDSALAVRGQGECGRPVKLFFWGTEVAIINPLGGEIQKI